PAPAGLPRRRRLAVRLLHAGHDHERRRPAGPQLQPEHARHRPRPGREHLPLRPVRAHRPGGAAGGRGAEGRWAVDSPPPPPQLPDLTHEPERYELSEEPRYQLELDRRDFVKLLGGGLVVLLLLDDTAEAQPPRRGGFGRNMTQELGAWLHVSEKGEVTAYTGK